MDSKTYLRLAHGWATPSSVGDIFSGQTRTDEFDNQLTSLFLGVPLSDTLFTLPINVYLTPGAVYHHSSEVQNSIWEYVLAVKFYYTVKWPTPWRIGFAEGVSYMNEVSYIERQYMERQGYRPSELLIIWTSPSISVWGTCSIKKPSRTFGWGGASTIARGYFQRLRLLGGYPAEVITIRSTCSIIFDFGLRISDYRAQTKTRTKPFRDPVSVGRNQNS